jgi:hypothetical protein
MAYINKNSRFTGGMRVSESHQYQRYSKQPSPLRRSFALKHSDELVEQIVRARFAGKKFPEIAEQFGLNLSVVYNYAKGYARPHVYDKVVKELGYE